LDTSRQTKNLNKLLIRILLHLQVEFSKGSVFPKFISYFRAIFKQRAVDFLCPKGSKQKRHVHNQTGNQVSSDLF